MRVTNPLASDESVLRATLLTGLVRAWARNVERGDRRRDPRRVRRGLRAPAMRRVTPRRARGGIGGAQTLALPRENERLTVVLGRPSDDARSAVALWRFMAERLGLADVVVRSQRGPRAVCIPRAAPRSSIARSGATLGYVGEVDARCSWTPSRACSAPRRLGIARSRPRRAGRPDARHAPRRPASRCRVAFRAPCSTSPSSRRARCNAADLALTLAQAQRARRVGDAL